MAFYIAVYVADVLDARVLIIGVLQFTLFELLYGLQHERCLSLLRLPVVAEESCYLVLIQLEDVAPRPTVQ